MHPYIHAQTHPDKPAYIMAGTGETVTQQLFRPDEVHRISNWVDDRQD